MRSARSALIWSTVPVKLIELPVSAPDPAERLPSETDKVTVKLSVPTGSEIERPENVVVVALLISTLSPGGAVMLGIALSLMVMGTVLEVVALLVVSVTEILSVSLPVAVAFVV